MVLDPEIKDHAHDVVEREVERPGGGDERRVGRVCARSVATIENEPLAREQLRNADNQQHRTDEQAQTKRD